jgi:two-component sensor histidine kinase
VKKYGRVSAADLDWLNRLTSDWQLIADMAIADLVLWVPGPDGSFLPVAHARPSGAVTVFYRDIFGEPAKSQWQPQLDAAFLEGEISEQEKPDIVDQMRTRFAAYPVRRRVSSKSTEVQAKPIAVVTKHTNLLDAKVPSKVQINYQRSALDLLNMVAKGGFPDSGGISDPRRGNPRVNDGLLRLDETGQVTFASPNGLSAFNSLGNFGELEGKSLYKAVLEKLRGISSDEESVQLVLSGRAAWRVDIDNSSTILSVRSIPLTRDGERIGALVLCRDATDFRKQEREVITKDATIREIHHRVKNNLQTVASLLRMQARRSASVEVKDSLKLAERRVSAIALVHDTLSEGLAQEVDFDEVFERILRLATEVASVNNTSVRTQLNGRFGQLRSEIATPLAVSLTELLTNAVEHGLAGRDGVVQVSVERRTKQLEVVVADSGVGFKVGDIGNGLGTQIIRTLVEGELRGRIHWGVGPDSGARASLSIPLDR